MGYTDLTFEAYSSNISIPILSFYKYRFCTLQNENVAKAINGTVYRLKREDKTDVFTDGKNIFSIQPLQKLKTDSYILDFVGKEDLPVCSYRKVYSELLESLIRENLQKRKVKLEGHHKEYNKYSYKDDISSGWFWKDGNFEVIKNKSKEIGLRRVFNIRVEIDDDGKAILFINTKCEYVSKYTLEDLIKKGQCVEGIEAINDWASNKQAVEVIGVSDKTVSEPQSDMQCSLKEYYCRNNQAYRVAKCADNTPAIRAKFKNGKNEREYLFYPQALKPVCTRERVAQQDPEFSHRTDSLMRLTMEERLKIDREFIQDIGKLECLNNLTFEEECCDARKLHYKTEHFQLASLLCGNNEVIQGKQTYRAFQYGFFQKNPEPLKMGYLYPAGMKEEMKAVANAIYLFAAKGKFHNQKDNYVHTNLLKIEQSNVRSVEYKPGSLLDYKRAARELVQESSINMIIALIPDEYAENPYPPFKEALAQYGVPSQMISRKTAHLFYEENKNLSRDQSKYYLQNLIPGILGKAGGIPWALEKMPGNADLFVGLDIATQEAKIHFPACSVALDQQGRLLGYYKPIHAQSGEKMNEHMLEEIFSAVILEYETTHHTKPKHIVIHRDGFSNEDDDWYKRFFAAEKIEYSIIEVRKNIYRKMVSFGNGDPQNPCIGSCLYSEKENKAFLITTDVEKRGSPNPLLIEKKYGEVTLTDAVKQVLYLSQLNASTHKSRLPITTYYADKICKNHAWVPEGKLNHSLFFL